MGLKPLQSNNTETVVVGDSMYYLREMVSVAEMEKTRMLVTEMTAQVERAKALKLDFQQGRRDDFRDIRRAFESANKAMYDAMAIWLVSWSHDDELNRANIERLEEADMNAIQQYIGRKLNGTNADPANPTPPEEPSGE